jgi:hypothetical protein
VLQENLASLVTEARAQVVPDVCAVLTRIATKLTMDDCVGCAALGPAVSSLARVAIKRGSSSTVSNIVLDSLGSIFNASDKVPLSELLCGYDSWCLSGESANVLVTLALRSWDQRQRLSHVADLLKLVKERSNDLYANSSEHRQARFGAYAVWKLDFTMSCKCVAALCDTDRATMGMEYPDLRDEIKRVAPMQEGTPWYHVDHVLLKGKHTETLLQRQQQAHQLTQQQQQQQEMEKQVVVNGGTTSTSSVSSTEAKETTTTTSPSKEEEEDSSALHGMTTSLVAAAAASASVAAVGGEKSMTGSKSTHKRVEMLGQWKLHKLGLDQSPASSMSAPSSPSARSEIHGAFSGGRNSVDEVASVAGTPTGNSPVGTPGQFPKAPTNSNQCPRSDAVKAVLRVCLRQDIFMRTFGY